VIEKNSKKRGDMAKLMQQMVMANMITRGQYSEGVCRILEFAGDLAVDIPKIYDYLAELIAPMVTSTAMPMDQFITETSAKLASADPAFPGR
jgi:translation initiation factor 4G